MMTEMSGYTKLFNSILASTIWRADDKTRIVWITLLAMADRHGIAEASIPGLADFARVSIPDCERALAELAAPDTYSRSHEHDGRRIEAIDGGFRLLNHAKYRAKMNADERREYFRLKQQEGREKKRRLSKRVNKRSDLSTELTHAEAEADPKANKNIRAPLRGASARVSETDKDAFTDRDITERAGRFLERYQVLYTKHRHGARYAVKPARDYAAAVTLCQTWPDERLDRLAVIFLTTDHPFAEDGSRTPNQFLALASWCDGLLATHEHQKANR